MLRSAATLVAGAAVLASSVLAAPVSFAQAVPEVLLEGAAVDEVLGALHEECYDAGMSVEASGGSIIVCNASLTGDERLLDGVAIINVHDGHVRHRIRFALAERAGGVRVWAYPWVEVEEPSGALLEEEIRSGEYLTRVRDVLARIGTRLASDAGAPAGQPWEEHYQSENDWRLDAHLRAVAWCDRRLGELRPDELDSRLDRELELAGFQSFGRSPRDRCEELYEQVFRWGLARGIDEPTVEGYADYRAALPPEERVCAGRLALTATCR